MAEQEKKEREYYFLHMWGCVEPNLYGPYDTEEIRDVALRKFQDDGNDREERDTIHCLDANKGADVEI